MSKPYPEQRFVRLRLASDHHHTITLVAGHPADASPLEANGVIQHIAAAMPEKHEAALTLLRFLKAHEAAFLDWVEASPENSHLFLHDPMTALSRLFPDLPSIDS